VRRSDNLTVKVVRIVKKLYFFGKITEAGSLKTIFESLMNLFDDSLSRYE
jgi:hypothetical protein